MRNSLKLLAPISLIVALAACSEESAEAPGEELATAEGAYPPSPVEAAEAAADTAEDAVAEIGSPPTQANRSAARLRKEKRATTPVFLLAFISSGTQRPAWRVNDTRGFSYASGTWSR